jgi:hypothetical protein
MFDGEKSDGMRVTPTISVAKNAICICLLTSNLEAVLPSRWKKL